MSVTDTFVAYFPGEKRFACTVGHRPDGRPCMTFVVSIHPEEEDKESVVTQLNAYEAMYIAQGFLKVAEALKKEYEERKWEKSKDDIQPENFALT